MSLVTAVRISHRATFQLSYLGQPATMPLCTAEPSGEKILRAVPGDRDAHRPASEAEYIQVIVLHSLTGRKVIVTKSRSRSAYLIRSHGGAYAAAAHENAALDVSTCHSAGEGIAKSG